MSNAATLTTPISENSYSSKMLLIARYLIIFTCFCLPLSTSATWILYLLTLFTLLSSGNWHTHYAGFLKNRMVHTFLLLGALYLVGITYSSAPAHNIVKVIVQHNWIFITPLLYPLFKEQKWQIYAINAFLVAMLITLICSYPKYYCPHTFHHIFTYKKGNITASVFKDHIIQNFLMALAAALIGYRFLNQNKWRIAYAITFVIMAYNILFMSAGRSGYFVFIALCLYLCFLKFSWKGLLLAFCSAAIIGGLAYITAPAFRTRINILVKNTKSYKSSADYTSVGIRFTLLHNGITLWKQKPIIGHGTGSIYSSYLTLPPSMRGTIGNINDFSNSYLNYLVQFGIVGLMILIIVLIMQWCYTYKSLNPEIRFTLQALLIGLAIGNLANSWLTDTTQVHLYSIFMALGFA